MSDLNDTLILNRCPHCSIDKPNLFAISTDIKTISDDKAITRVWKVYSCKRCAGVVTACFRYDPYNSTNRRVTEVYPVSESISEILPFKIKSYLRQAIESIYAPAGSVMLCASAVDEMLKEKGYKDGKLYSRINQASKAGLLTPDMAIWAHQVRLDANDQRHSDEEAELPTIEDAKKSIEFTKVLAEFLFVLPSKVKTGIDTTTPKVQQQ